jgi:ubiquinone/menaquinone biosynthesis C-methylase UbiE
VNAEELKTRFIQAGFTNVHFKRLMGGVMAIHWGEK